MRGRITEVNAKLRSVGENLFCVQGSIKAFIPKESYILDYVRGLEKGTPIIAFVREVRDSNMLVVYRVRVNRDKYPAIFDKEVANKDDQGFQERRKLKKGWIKRKPLNLWGVFDAE